jgi:hypothetical protein
MPNKRLQLDMVQRLRCTKPLSRALGRHRTMSTKLLLGWLLLLADCAPIALGPLVVDGQELHASLVTRKLKDAPKFHLAGGVLRDNPCLSTDADFVDIIARIASQDRLGGEEIRAALYALYLGESEVGVYGLEAASLRTPTGSKAFCAESGRTTRVWGARGSTAKARFSLSRGTTGCRLRAGRRWTRGS